MIFAFIHPTGHSFLLYFIQLITLIVFPIFHCDIPCLRPYWSEEEMIPMCAAFNEHALSMRQYSLDSVGVVAVDGIFEVF